MKTETEAKCLAGKLQEMFYQSSDDKLGEFVLHFLIVLSWILEDPTLVSVDAESCFREILNSEDDDQFVQLGWGEAFSGKRFGVLLLISDEDETESVKTFTGSGVWADEALQIDYGGTKPFSVLPEWTKHIFPGRLFSHVAKFNDCDWILFLTVGPLPDDISIQT